MEAGAFNLADEAWVPVLGRSGEERRSLRDVLREAHQFTELDGLTGPEAAAMIRLLVAVVLDIVPLETFADWEAAWEAGQFDEALIDDYFAAHHDRFELFDGPRPFYQVADLEPMSPTGIKPVALILPEVASGNNVPLWSNLIDEQVPALTPAQAAIRLLSAQAHDTAAIKTAAQGDPQAKAGKTTGNPTGVMGALGVTVIMGRTLFETILLNCPVGRPAHDDLPAWRREFGPTWEKRPAKGVKELLTWQSRRIRLMRNGEGLVSHVVLAAGDRLDHVPETEPHTLWRQVPDGPTARRPARHAPGRSLWHGMTALTAVTPWQKIETSANLVQAGDLIDVIGEDYPLDVLCVGVVYGNQSAVVEDVVVRRVPLPVIALVESRGQDLRDLLTGLAGTADAVVLALNRLDGDLRRARGGNPVEWDKAQRLGDVFIAALDDPTRQLLGELQSATVIEEPFQRWESAAWRVASELADQRLAAAPPEAFRGRGSINQAQAAVFFRAALRTALPRGVARMSNKEER